MKKGRLSVLTFAATALLAGTAGYFVGVRRQPKSEAATREVSAPKLSRTPRETVARISEPGADAAAMKQTSWIQRWQGFATNPRTPRTSRAMAELLQELATRDHDGALRLALAEPNVKLHRELRNAVLRGWAEKDAASAATYALSLREDDRAEAITELLAGAAKQPADAAVLTGTICDRDPARAFDYTNALIAALGDQGKFDVAVSYLASRPATPQRLEETDHAFSLWAEHQPAQATAMANAITDPELRAAAFRGAAIGWSQADPAGLADFALHLPPGESRGLALANAMPRWVEADPDAAATWLAQREPDPDFDSGVAAVALVPSMVVQKPELAMSLAQSITDSSLRTTTLHSLALEWAKTDANAAGRYVEASRVFSDSERAVLLAEIRVGGGG